jgi:hypothetical protein
MSSTIRPDGSIQTRTVVALALAASADGFSGGAVVLYARTRLTETQNVVLVDAVLTFNVLYRRQPTLDIFQRQTSQILRRCPSRR